MAKEADNIEILDSYDGNPEFEEPETEEVVAPDTEEPPETPEPETTEPVSTEPEEKATPDTGTEVEETPDKPEDVDEEPEPNAELLEKMAKMEKRLEKADRRTLYLQRKLEEQEAADKKVDAEAAFEAELAEKYPAPDVDDFETYKEYEDALMQQKIDIGIAKGLRGRDAPAADPDTGEVVPNQERVAFTQKTVNSGKETYDDFTDVVLQDTVPITDEMIDAAMEMDSETVNPEDVFYYLGKHPTEAAKISRMNPDQVKIQIVKIEARLEAVKEKTPAPEPKKKPGSKIKDVSAAPAPTTPTDSTVIITKDPNKMSQAEYEKWRAATERV